MRWLPVVTAGCVALGLRSSGRELDALLQRFAGPVDPDCDALCTKCRHVVGEVGGEELGVDFGARLRRNCAGSDLVPDKKQCAGVTRMAETFTSWMVEDDERAKTPVEACTDIQRWLLTIARDLHALDTATVSDPACIRKVQNMTSVTAPVPKANFTKALKDGCTVSCDEVILVASHVLEDYDHPVTPKAYCRLHEDWLEKVGIYDVDAFFSLLLGKTTDGAAQDTQVRSGKYPGPLQATRDQNSKIFDILSRKAATQASAGALALAALVAVLS